ncbi:unnamed protein product, partial [Amoebophrya sp. A120]
VQNNNSLIPNLAENLRKEKIKEKSLSPAHKKKIADVRTWIQVCVSLHDLLTSKPNFGDVFVEDVKNTVAQVKNVMQDRAADALEKIHIKENIDKVKEKATGFLGVAGKFFGGVANALLEEQDGTPDLADALGHLRRADEQPAGSEQTAMTGSAASSQRTPANKQMKTILSEESAAKNRADTTPAAQALDAAGANKGNKRRRSSFSGRGRKSSKDLRGRRSEQSQVLVEDDFFDQDARTFPIETP